MDKGKKRREPGMIYLDKENSKKPVKVVRENKDGTLYVCFPEQYDQITKMLEHRCYIIEKGHKHFFQETRKEIWENEPEDGDKRVRFYFNLPDGSYQVELSVEHEVLFRTKDELKELELSIFQWLGIQLKYLFKIRKGIPYSAFLEQESIKINSVSGS